MNTVAANDVMSNRKFVALVRAKLDAAGRTDIAIDRLWINEDSPGYKFLLNVPVGAELVVPLRAQEGPSHRSAEAVDWHIDYFAQALINLKSAEKMLAKYALEVRREAHKQIKAARAAGLDVSLENVGFEPTYAVCLSGSDWKEAADHVLAQLTVRNTSFFLRPETSHITVEEPADVAKELKWVLEDQRKHQARLAEMDALGADLEVDAITIDLLVAHGFDPVEILRQVWKTQCVNLAVPHGGFESHFSLVSFDGRVTAGINLGNAYWNGGHLWFLDEERLVGNEDLVGKTLGGVIDHPAFASRSVLKVVGGQENGRRDLVFVDLSDKLLFDADTGRIWGQERLAA